MPRGVYKRKKKKDLVFDETLKAIDPPREIAPVDPIKLQFPKPIKNQPFGICRNRARNVEKALKDEK